MRDERDDAVREAHDRVEVAFKADKARRMFLCVLCALAGCLVFVVAYAVGHRRGTAKAEGELETLRIRAVDAEHQRDRAVQQTGEAVQLVHRWIAIAEQERAARLAR